MVRRDSGRGVSRSFLAPDNRIVASLWMLCGLPEAVPGRSSLTPFGAAAAFVSRSILLTVCPTTFREWSSRSDHVGFGRTRSGSLLM